MTSALEPVVRPFQTNTPAQRVTPANQVGTPIVLFTAGRTGVGRSFQGSLSEIVKSYMTQYVNETKNS